MMSMKAFPSHHRRRQRSSPTNNNNDNRVNTYTQCTHPPPPPPRRDSSCETTNNSNVCSSSSSSVTLSTSTSSSSLSSASLTKTRAPEVRISRCTSDTITQQTAESNISPQHTRSQSECCGIHGGYECVEIESMHHSSIKAGSTAAAAAATNDAQMFVKRTSLTSGGGEDSSKSSHPYNQLLVVTYKNNQSNFTEKKEYNSKTAPSALVTQKKKDDDDITSGAFSFDTGIGEIQKQQNATTTDQEVAVNVGGGSGGSSPRRRGLGRVKQRMSRFIMRRNQIGNNLSPSVDSDPVTTKPISNEDDNNEDAASKPSGEESSVEDDKEDEHEEYDLCTTLMLLNNKRLDTRLSSPSRDEISIALLSMDCSDDALFDKLPIPNSNQNPIIRVPPPPTTPNPNSINKSGRNNNNWSNSKLDFCTKCLIPPIPRTNNDPSKRKITSWNSIPASSFQLRCGPDYNRHKTKSPSNPSLYDVVAVRCFNTRSRLKTPTAPYLPLPHQFTTTSPQHPKSADIPQLLILHIQIPYETPSMFSSKKDGAGGEVLLYLQPSPEVINHLQSTSSSAAALQLFQTWYKTASTNEAMRKRFKVISSLQNLPPSQNWIQPYNGKPVLVTESGSIATGVLNNNDSSNPTISYLEFRINIHAWGFLAKKGFHSVLPLLKDMEIDLGFTIEAQEEEELPECLLGCVGLNYFDYKNMETVEDLDDLYGD